MLYFLFSRTNICKYILFNQKKKNTRNRPLCFPVDTPHNNWGYHIHLSGGNGKLNNLHIQIAKAAYDYLKKIL